MLRSEYNLSKNEANRMKSPMLRPSLDIINQLEYKAPISKLEFMIIFCNKFNNHNDLIVAFSDFFKIKSFKKLLKWGLTVFVL